MNRTRTIGVVVGVALLVGLAGCAGIGGSSADAGVGGEADLERSIDVSAGGEAVGEPDRATLRVAVTATGSTPEAVRDDLATGDSRLREALTEWGLDEDDIRTDRYDVRETHESRDDPDREAYQGIHRYAIDVDDVDAVGSVIDVTVDAGADEVQQIQFGLSEERERDVRDEALENAMANADADAETLAAASDLDVTGVYSVSTGDASWTPYAVRDAAVLESADSGGAPATGIETGDVTVRVTVNVVYGAEA
ncbi:SIMPL domain-containing protein [Halorubrum aidingense]|uniref:SIMPL domain-containing protein n=1 Tax=Halorubrum aidingense TaxID=368623 RepID=UPI00067803DE|nr:SIMPL domain-containing protein [Halorubrum aidingense]